MTDRAALIERLEAGIRTDKCRIINAENRCDCVMAAALLRQDAEARDAALEEAAKVADEQFKVENTRTGKDAGAYLYAAMTCQQISSAIRALKETRRRAR